MNLNKPVINNVFDIEIGTTDFVQCTLKQFAKLFALEYLEMIIEYSSGFKITFAPSALTPFVHRISLACRRDSCRQGKEETSATGRF